MDVERTQIIHLAQHRHLVLDMRGNPHRAKGWDDPAHPRRRDLQRAMDRKGKLRPRVGMASTHTFGGVERRLTVTGRNEVLA